MLLSRMKDIDSIRFIMSVAYRWWYRSQAQSLGIFASDYFFTCLSINLQPFIVHQSVECYTLNSVEWKTSILFVVLKSASAYDTTCRCGHSVSLPVIYILCFSINLQSFIVHQSVEYYPLNSVEWKSSILFVVLKSALSGHSHTADDTARRHGHSVFFTSDSFSVFITQHVIFYRT